MTMTQNYSVNELAAIIEALIFTAERPLSLSEITRTIAAEIHSSINAYTFPRDDEESLPETGSGKYATVAVEETEPGGQAFDLQIAALRPQVYEAIELLKQAYADPQRLNGRGFTLMEVAGGYAFRSRAEYGPFIRRRQQARPQRLSKASMECLAIIAYQQPVTKPQIDTIRGVDSGGVVKSLLDRGLVRVVGRREEPGRPLLYGTTPGFLSLFNIKGLSDLPALRDLAELEHGLFPESVDPPLTQGTLWEAVTPIQRQPDDDERLLVKVDRALEKLKEKTAAAEELLAGDKNSGDDKK